MLSKSKLVELMTMMSDMFNFGVSELKLKMYYDALKDYSDQKVEMAIKKLIKTHKYSTMPVPANIIECLNSVSQEETQDYKNMETDKQLKLIIKKAMGEQLTTEEIHELKVKAGLV